MGENRTPRWLVCHDLEGTQYVQHLREPNFLAKFSVDGNRVGKIYDFVWLNGHGLPEDNHEFHLLLEMASRFVGDYNDVTTVSIEEMLDDIQSPSSI